MWKKLFFRKGEDRGDGVLTLCVLSVPLLMLVSGFAIDLNKAVYVQSSFQLMAQEATSQAVRSLDEDLASGTLQEEAVTAVVNNYNAQFTGGEASALARGSYCTTVEDANGEEKPVPYMEITLSDGRVGGSTAPVSYEYDPVSGLEVVGGSYVRGASYTKISTTVYDSSPNLFMGMFGQSCQTVRPQVSAVTFGSQEDLTPPEPEEEQEQN